MTNYFTKSEIVDIITKSAKEFGFSVSRDKYFYDLPMIESEYLNFYCQTLIAGYDWEKMLVLRRLIIKASFRGQERLGYTDLHKAAEAAKRGAELLEKLNYLNIIWIEDLYEKENRK